MSGIGQWEGSEAKFFDLLAKDGARVMQNYLAAQIPWTNAPIIRVITGFICSEISKFLAKNLDKLAYAGFVSVRVGSQMSDYIKAQDTEDKEIIDQTGSDFIHLGKL